MGNSGNEKHETVLESIDFMFIDTAFSVFGSSGECTVTVFHEISVGFIQKGKQSVF